MDSNGDDLPPAGKTSGYTHSLWYYFFFQFPSSIPGLSDLNLRGEIDSLMEAPLYISIHKVSSSSRKISFEEGLKNLKFRSLEVVEKSTAFNNVSE